MKTKEKGGENMNGESETDGEKRNGREGEHAREMLI